LLNFLGKKYLKRNTTSTSFLIIFIVAAAVMPAFLMSDTLIPAFAVHEHNATIITDGIIVNADLAAGTFTSITGVGTITAGTWNGVDIAVADGGTGASSLTDGGVLLGSGTGAVTVTAVLADGEFIVGDGTTDPVLESGATARTSLGLDTMAVQSASSVAITGGSVTGITDLTIADGGTGTGSFVTGGVLLGGATLTDTGVIADSTFIVGDGSGAPSLENAATARTSLGLGDMATQSASSVAITGGSITGVTISGSTPTDVVWMEKMSY